MRTRVRYLTLVLGLITSFFIGISPALAAACTPSSSVSGGNTTLTFTNTTSCDWTVPANITSALTIVVVGGGGGGGYYGNAGGGGGGAVLVTTNFALTPGAVIPIVVGAGGAGSSAGPGSNGGNTTFNSTVIAAGGGGGAGGDANDGVKTPNGLPGGSGGGGESDNSATTSGGAATASASAPWTAYGNSGAGGSGGSGGGGGGAGSAGSGSTGGSGKTFLGVTFGAGGSVPTSTSSSNSGNGGGWANGGDAGVVKIQYANPHPTFSYQNSSQTTSAGVAFAANPITSTGTAITSFSIAPALPAALSFNTSTGAITGTPNALLSATTYTITGTDASSATGTTTLTLTITVGSAIVSMTGSSQLIIRTTAVETATVNVAGKVVFFWNGKRIPGCQKIPTTGTNPIIAVCTWRPSVKGAFPLTATLYPSNSSVFTSGSSNSYWTSTIPRGGNR